MSAIHIGMAASSPKKRPVRTWICASASDWMVSHLAVSVPARLMILLKLYFMFAIIQRRGAFLVSLSDSVYTQRMEYPCPKLNLSHLRLLSKKFIPLGCVGLHYVGKG